MNEVVNMTGFAFVQRLAKDLNAGTVKIPSFPDIVVRIKKTLDDENCNTEKLTRVVVTEPALAARLLTLSNSALMQRGDAAVYDLRTAINRLGFVMVRNAAMSVAIEQIFIGTSIGPHRSRLREIWKDAARVAAISFALSQHLKNPNPDEALMAGLLHNVGKLYILMNAAEFEDFIDTEEALDDVIECWHGQIGRAIIEGWGFSEAMATAAADHMDLDRAVYGPPDLTDVVTVAWLMTHPQDNDVDANSKPVRAYSRIGLDEEKRIRIFEESRADIEALTAALGG